MNKAARISASQLTVLLLGSRLSQVLLIRPDGDGSMNLPDRLLTTALSGALLFLLLLPTLWFCRSSAGTIGCAYACSRTWGRALGVGYVGLFLFILGFDALQFYDFAEKVMKSGFSVTLLTAALIASALAASLYGIRTLARAALPITVFAVLCLLVFGVALVPEMRMWHFPPVASAGVGRIFRVAVRELPRSAEVAAVGLLCPYVRGAKTRAVAAFSGLTVLCGMLVSTTVLGVLGDFAALTVYPYYTAVTAAQVSVFGRMDILVAAVWLSTFFVRMTLFGTLLSDVVQRLGGRRARWTSTVACTVLLTAFVYVVRRRQEWQFISGAYSLVLATVCLVLPALLCVLKRRKRV